MNRKKAFLSALAFFVMFVFAAGSVVLSCAGGTASGAGSAPGAAAGERLTTVNTGPAQDGRIYTNWEFREIHSVLVTDLEDRSRKRELREGEWEYRRESTELILLPDIPFADYVVHVEGINAFPNSFVLTDYRGELLVVLEDRLAVRDFDYTFSEENRRLVFREDIPLHHRNWLIRYNTSVGSASIGELKGREDWDYPSYLEAEQRKRFLDNWYDSQDEFYFFDPAPYRPGDLESPPGILRRAAAPEELAAMKSYPLSVFKSRFNAGPGELARELGFPAEYPEEIPGREPGTFLPLTGKIIEEQAREGKVVRDLLLHYGYGETAEIRLSLEPPRETDPGISEARELYLIDREVPPGLSAERVRLWAQVSPSGPDFLDVVPEVKPLTVWVWRKNGVYYSLSGLSEDDQWYERIVRTVTAASGASGASGG